MNTIERLSVDLGDRSYPIYIGEGALDVGAYLTDAIAGKQVFIVTNVTVANLYLDDVIRVLNQAVPGIKIDSVALPDGEQYKNLETLNLIFTGLLEARHNRNTTLVALGGGVVGDMAGFAAASYQRGIPFIQIPTTLLSQVDSSVGGKTGVNHLLGKNMIGAFYQPNAVLIDTRVLSTLPDRELSAGLAEVIKYGLISDQNFFCWLEDNIDALLTRDTEALKKAILRSCEIKAEVVAKDEKEGGIRAILNLGHTYGHAIETQMGYGTWLHGEAVAAGMVMACDLSVRLGWLDRSVLDRAKSLISAARLPTSPPNDMSGVDFEKHMKVDKKVLDGAIRLVLLKGCGYAVTTSDYDDHIFQAQLSEL